MEHIFDFGPVNFEEQSFYVLASAVARECSAVDPSLAVVFAVEVVVVSLAEVVVVITFRIIAVVLILFIVLVKVLVFIVFVRGLVFVVKIFFKNALFSYFQAEGSLFEFAQEHLEF